MTRAHVPVPARCATRPLTPDGLVVPWGNVQLADGGCDFRSHHHRKWLSCWREGRCQVCGQPPTELMVMLCGPRQLEQLLFDEPPVHPECAVYVTQACPMVAGERERYRAGDNLAARSRGAVCPDPGCDCGGWVRHPGTGGGPGGDPAHEWYAVTVRDYTLAMNPDRQVIGGVCSPDQVARVRLVSRPGERYAPPGLPVPDWRDRYQAPETFEEPGVADVRH